MKRFIPNIFIFFFYLGANSQSIDLQQLEARFLSENTQLLAAKYEISKKEAEVIQAKLWANPTLSISEVNMWSTYRIEEQPYLWGNYGNTQQIAVELEQLIETAGKRRKRAAVKELETKHAVLDFEDLLRSLKKDLRMTYFSLARVIEQQKEVSKLTSLFEELQKKYKKQTHLQNLPKADYFRIQSELIELYKEQATSKTEEMQLLTKLRLLTHQRQLETHHIDFKLFNAIPEVPTNNIVEIAHEQNLGLKKQQNKIALAQSEYKLEKAARVPDLSVQINYDRGGNIMRDFFGVGVQIDLPIFNTNKQAIHQASINTKKQQKLLNYKSHSLDSTIEELLNKLKITRKILSYNLSEQLNEHLTMADNYYKHLNNKQITLLQFIDFIQAFRDAQNAYLELVEEYHHDFEELQYLVGKDL